MTSAEQEADAPPAKKKMLPKWIMLAVGVVFMIKGGSELYDAFFGGPAAPVLAQCGDPGVKDALTRAAKSRDVDLVSFADVKQLSRTDRVAQCTAIVTDPKHNKGLLFYRVDFKNGGNIVHITGEKPA